MKTASTLTLTLAAAATVFSLATSAEAGTLNRLVLFGPAQIVNPGSKVSLNPQPLPPGSAVFINPQPLPPRTW